MTYRKELVPAALSLAALAAPAAAWAGYANGKVAPVTAGPSSSESSYIVPTQKHVGATSLLTVGDSVNDKPDGTPYRMVGVPDGLGAFDNGNGTFTVLMNHELRPDAGIVREHGATGAFVSTWTVDKKSLEVLHGEDLIEQVVTWDPAAGAYDAPATGVVFNRFCSADLAELSAFYNPATGTGYNGRLYTNGEETSPSGRAFAHALDGTSYELPALGKMAFENVVPNPGTGDETVVVATDDTTPGQVYLFHGRKQTAGSPVTRAGLDHGTLYGVKVPGIRDESTGDFVPSGSFELAELGDVRNLTGPEFEAASDAAEVTEFWRPEDAHWDPNDPNVLYFVTTANFDGPSRLWRLTFNDASNLSWAARSTPSSTATRASTCSTTWSSTAAAAR